MRFLFTCGPSMKYITLQGGWGPKKSVTVCDRGRGVEEHVMSHYLTLNILNHQNSVTYFMDGPLFIVQCSVLFSLTCCENRLVGVVYTNNFVLLHWFYIGDWLDVHLDPPVTCPLVNYINLIVIDDWILYFVANKNYLLTYLLTWTFVPCLYWIA